MLDDLLGTNQRLHESLKGAVDAGGDDPTQEARRKEQEKARLREGSTQLRGAASKQIDEILTRRQRELFARLLGPRFDFSRIQK